MLQHILMPYWLLVRLVKFQPTAISLRASGKFIGTLTLMKTHFQDTVGEIRKVQNCSLSNTNEYTLWGNTKNSDESNKSPPLPAAL